MRLPIGISDFQKVATDNYAFADKSLFIKDIMDNGTEIILITRPRRFGKTLNLSMLRYFLDINMKTKDIFKDLNISDEKEFCNQHQNKYPVIFITLKDIKAGSYEVASRNIISLISALYTDHIYLLEDDTLLDHEKKLFQSILERTINPEDVKDSLKLLSKFLYRKFSIPPIILIDEYDTPIQEAYLRGYYGEMVDFMRPMLGSALKDNSALSKAILTGITRISQESLFSGLNNFEVYSLLREEYGQYFGFSEMEVKELIKKTDQTLDIEPIREWYNGYQVGKYTLYNPWSIINCLKSNGALKPYWVNTSSDTLLKQLITSSNSNIKETMEKLLQGDAVDRYISENLIFPDIERKESSLWSLLLYAGYLKSLSSKVENYNLIAKLAVPNKEVSFVFNNIVLDWFGDALNLESYSEFIASFKAGDMDKVKKYIEDYIMQSGSYFDFNINTPEQVFHGFILGIISGLKDIYVISSNRESGRGRADMVMIPKDKKSGIVLEFKVAKTKKDLKIKANEGLKQITDNEYLSIFQKEKVTSVLAISLAFCGKEVELAHKEITTQ